MNAIAPPLIDPVHYPESDGLPMADTTKQFDWIVTIKCGLEAMFRHNPEVFVAGNLLWYPVQGNNKIHIGPDVFVAFGRPKGDRGSYLQWLEDNIPPHVVFEVLSPGNRAGALQTKFEFYQLYGVEEYYIYDPDNGTFEGWIREHNAFKEIRDTQGWVSPRLQVKFELADNDLQLYTPDGEKFSTFVQVVEQRELARREMDKAQREKKKMQREKDKVERENEKIQQEKEKIQQETLKAQQRAERLAAQLKALGIEPEE